ncbi:methylthioribulose-1-phosphate dehydratase [Peribacillus simplex]|uniref:Methylthioribulose-1-phosphate dehydratase n=1 Tax=Peribacillus simplex TaxID=1478 RepID=A0A109N2R8_9BACI|nr:methylthioribulose 1-phosphate dehydratase [Peribacillus simplex]KWW22408.1 methylthioribulose-1-phosphate dehydratase [Peribacillus simplex]
MNTGTKEWLELAEIKAELAERDWFMGTSGNLSIREPDSRSFYITASGKDKRKQSDSDFILVDLKGNPVEETELRPSAETLLHTVIYEKTKANCVLHVHTVENNVVSELYGDEGSVTFRNHEIIKATGRWDEESEFRIPIIYNHADIPLLAEKFNLHVQEDCGAVLIRNHGITVWGKSGLEAKKILEACEFLFQYQLLLNSQRTLTASLT